LKLDKNTLAQMRELCAEIDPDDGMDENTLRRRYQRPRSHDRKTRQLCGQIARALNLTLAAADDETLRRLLVTTVKDMPDDGRFLVEVAAPDDLSPEEAQARLSAARGWLREEVAHAIRRKRVPELRYLVLISEVRA